ncbi:MAG TPA: SNF2-related protein [Verrucomicrobiae bacterium]|jgi:superfamily II DNA or RNA helicase|nr:SNF2-related protein [Verrucomicrobiae bacterium]
MSDVELSDALLAKLGGWEAVKTARGIVSAGRVHSSEWQPPTLRGVLQEGTGTLRSGLIIKSSTDAENLCPCRDSRQRGLICAHSIAIGLHFLKAKIITSAPAEKKSPEHSTSKRIPKAIRRATPDDVDEWLKLHFILPPNLNEALGRGKVMLYVEGEWSRGRVPLNALPTDLTYALDSNDQIILDALEALNEGDTPAMLMLNASQFAALLPKLAAHERLTLGRAKKIEILQEPLRLAITANLESNGEIVLRLKGGLPVGLIRGNPPWVTDGDTLRPMNLPSGAEELLDGPWRISRSRLPQFLNVDWPKLMAACEVEANFTLNDFSFEAAKPFFSLHLAGGLAVLEGKLECTCGVKKVTPGVFAPGEELWLPDLAKPAHYRTRDLEAEQAAVRRLVKSGFTGPDAAGLFHLKGQNQVLNFFAREFPKLEKEWKVTLEERLERSTEKNLERIEPRFDITPSGEEWFNLNVTYDTRGGERLGPADIQRLLLSGQGHTKLKNGKFALLDTGAVEELQEVLLDCAPEQNSGGYRLDNWQAGFLDATLRQQASWQVRAPAAWSQRAAQQRGEVKPETPNFGALESVLRPYQKEGIAWMAFLRVNGFGGILADEMGLGKTLQVLALISARKNQSSDKTTPTLVICPTSLVFNWAAEAAKFTPQLRVLALHGTQRHESFQKISQADLIVTSYALLRRDADRYRDLEFDTVVLDEAQHIKNRQTQNAQAVKSIRARHRLVLTGTPLENSVLDLWSIFDFLMPGYLGAAKDFRERYEIAIVRDKNTAAQERLARRLRPFILRRLKREVARDLPEKIEQVSYCELNEEQRAIYQQVLDASRREIFTAVNANGLPKSRMVVLTALLRLRQICCDLRLLKLPANAGEDPEPPSQPAPKISGSSGKVELFGELLEEVIDGSHRVLVFSQFTSMLGLLREELTEQGIQFCYLDGATKDRAQVVEKFQRDAGIPVFLISLKAGGVGLNLTGADTVVHFDPWWNPAVEAQATDRAHRIGQTRVVTSYKLITRGTVEEKILNLQARKRALIEGVLGEGDLAGALSWEEIQDLLAD